jgi:hypothetical protein
MELEGVFRTLDGGETWQPFNQGFVDDLTTRPLYTEYETYLRRAPLKLLVDPRQTGNIYLAAQNGVFLAKDDGDAWEKVLEANIGIHLVVAVHQSSGRLYAQTWEHDFHWSDDGGRSWSSHDGFKVFGDRIIIKMIVHPLHTDHLLVGGGGGLQDNFLYSSTDNGMSWNFLQIPDDDPDIDNITVSPHAPDRVFVSSRSRIFQSDDFGASWNEIPSPGTPCKKYLEVDPHRPGILYCGNHPDIGLVNMYNLNTQSWQILEGSDRFHFNSLAFSSQCPYVIGYYSEGRIGSHPEPRPYCGPDFGIVEMGSLLRISTDWQTWRPILNGLPIVYSDSGSISIVSTRLSSLAISSNNPEIFLATFAYSQDIIFY